MSRINVVVTTTSDDVKAEVIAESVERRPDMKLIGPSRASAQAANRRSVPASEVDAVLESLPQSEPCAVVLVGRPGDINELAEKWLARRENLVVMHLDLVGDIVRITLRDPKLDSFFTALVGLVEHVGNPGGERFARVQLKAPDDVASEQRPLLHVCVEWVHALLRDAVASVSDENGDVNGLSVTRKTLLQSLDSLDDRAPEAHRPEAVRMHEALDRALETPDATAADALAIAAQTFGLDGDEFRLMVLGLSPELDLRFQRCIGFLLDDMGRRAGTMALYHMLLGFDRWDLGRGHLERWLVFERYSGRPPAGDEPLRIDPLLAQWLLGERDAIANDPLIRRSLRLVPWPGTAVLKLLERREEGGFSGSLIEKLRGASALQWIILGGDDPAEWRALLELGASIRNVTPIRVDSVLLAGIEATAIEECALRVGRMARLTGRPLIIDVVGTEVAEGEDDRLRLFFATLHSTDSQAAVICQDQARVVRLLGQLPYELLNPVTRSVAVRVAAARAAASAADAYLSEEAAVAMVNRYPLHVDGLEHAMHLARSRPKQYGAADPGLARFMTACKDVAAEGLSHLAERIEPVFELDEVVLPPDRKQQLVEIVDNIRLAPRVLDEWRFRDQLPYGRGVTALFFGPSGTGKTMAAIGIAHRLGVQLLSLDLSRIASKWIGDSSKHIDRVFTDAHNSGSAILINEAEALVGKRSEVKDSHDRYANMEVAYLLQRMEAYEGLAILTTNMRQNIDPAFLRRLRFILEFPRPDVAARERIWRQCLPTESHSLDDAAFRQLARRIDLTGGHIRQITLRAAFVAAAAGAQIGLEHIAQAARAEFAKLGMPPVEIDLSQSRKAA